MEQNDYSFGDFYKVKYPNVPTVEPLYQILMKKRSKSCNMISDRLYHLSLPKLKINYHERKDYSTSIYDPSNVYNRNAMKCNISKRTELLSMSKLNLSSKGTSEENTSKRISTAKSHMNFEVSRNQVSHSAKTYTPSDRIISLAKPNNIKSNEVHTRSEFSSQVSDPTNSGVYNKAALKYVPSNSLRRLSNPKEVNRNFKPANPVERTVSASAKNYVMSERIEALAANLPKPKKHKY